MAAEMGFKPATLRTKDIELTTEPPCPNSGRVVETDRGVPLVGC